MSGRWAGVIEAAECLRGAIDNGRRKAAVVEAAEGLLAELAYLWVPEPAAGVLTSPGTPAAGAGEGASHDSPWPWCLVCRHALTGHAFARATLRTAPCRDCPGGLCQLPARR